MTFTIPNFRKMLFFLALFISCFKGFSQNKLITLQLKNKPISFIIKSIEEKSDFRIIYNARKIDTDQLADINVQNASLETTLTQLLAGKNISFYIQNKQVLLTNSAPAPTSNNQEKARFISGIVYSAKEKLPLAGATIRVKGTGMGAITDFNGKFVYELKGNNISNLVLEVGFLGMESQSVKADNKKEFVFYLEEFTDELNQVVITSSYGTKKLKEEIVGSISTLNAKDIAVQQASESIDKMVEGQIAGVLVENVSGVGTPVKINIRGQGTLSSLTNAKVGTSSQPLIIIDGLVMSEEMGIDNSFFDGNGDADENFSNPLMKIAPENIESFTVLKDAAAVGIYGADGANGVILITTKRGKKGKTQFGFSNQSGISSAINQIKYLNGEQYNEIRNEFLKNTTPGFVPVPYNGVNTDWFDLLNNAGYFNKYNLNVSGSTSKFSYRSNVSYLKIDEPQLGNNSKQLNLGVNLGYRATKWDINLMLNPSYIQKDAPNIFYNFAYLPTISPFNADGTYAKSGLTGTITGGNPFAAIAQNKNQTQTYGILGSLSLGYEITKGLRFSTLFGIDYTDKEQDRYFSGENESGQFNGSFVLDQIIYPTWGRRLINQRNSTRWNWQGQLLFEKQLNKNHAIDGLIGMELSEDKTNFDYASANGFVNPNQIHDVSEALRDDNPDTAIDETKSAQNYTYDISYNSKVSAFSQINYNYKKRYYFLANFRRDQSSVFGNDSDVANNGGAGFSWITSNENFLKSTSWIDLLKFKVSYGTTGNSRIGSYRSKGLYNIKGNGYNGGDEATPGSAPNENLGWEKNTKFNVGIDFNIFNRVELLLEYYYDDLSDLITTRDVPTETGYSSVQLNASSMYNKGFEFTTRIKWIKSDRFKWTTSFNISTVKNKVTELKGLGSDYSVATIALAQKVGYSTTTLWGINWVGVDPATGRDLLEKDGKVYDAATYRSLFTNADWVPIGDKQADAYGGFNNNFTINKNIVLSIRGAFQLGGDVLIQDVLIDKYSNTLNRNLSVNAYDHWRQPGDIVTQSSVSTSPITANLSKYIYDGTFLKISDINLSYNVPLKNTFLDNLAVFADASNVWYWYKEKSPKGMNGIREFNFSYPQARTISIGMNAKF